MTEIRVSSRSSRVLIFLTFLSHFSLEFSEGDNKLSSDQKPDIQRVICGAFQLFSGGWTMASKDDLRDLAGTYLEKMEAKDYVTHLQLMFCEDLFCQIPKTWV